MLAAQFVSAAASADSPGQKKFTCIGCRVKFETAELQRSHFKSEWHLYNLKRKVCSLEPIELDSFNQIQAATAASSKTRDDDEASLADMRLRLVEVPNEPDIESIQEDDDEDDDDWEKIEDITDDEATRYGEDEIMQMLAGAVDCDTCLFCGKKSHNLNGNVRHMEDMHGFFIPEERYLVDREGLIEYLGFKVGSAAICLWCDKQCTTGRGAQMHMLQKNHCKIFYDQERATSEFKVFYDYSSQEQFEMKPFEQLVLHRRGRSRRPHEDSQQIVVRADKCNGATSRMNRAKVCLNRRINKWDSYRSKILLRTGLANNSTKRDRFRMRNPTIIGS